MGNLWAEDENKIRGRRRKRSRRGGGFVFLKAWNVLITCGPLSVMQVEGIILGGAVYKYTGWWLQFDESTAGNPEVLLLLTLVVQVTKFKKWAQDLENKAISRECNGWYVYSETPRGISVYRILFFVVGGSSGIIRKNGLRRDVSRRNCTWEANGALVFYLILKHQQEVDGGSGNELWQLATPLRLWRSPDSSDCQVSFKWNHQQRVKTKRRRLRLISFQETTWEWEYVTMGIFLYFKTHEEHQKLDWIDHSRSVTHVLCANYPWKLQFTRPSLIVNPITWWSTGR